MSKGKPKYRFDICRMTADCEANYLRLGRLLPEMAAMSARVMARQIPAPKASAALLCRVALPFTAPSERTLDVQFHLLAQSRFTSSLSVKVDLSLDQAARYLSPPMVLNVQVYHDIKLAEVVSISGSRASLASYRYPNGNMFLPDEKCQQNQLLAEWLGRCLNEGVAIDINVLSTLSTQLKIDEMPKGQVMDQRGENNNLLESNNKGQQASQSTGGLQGALLKTTTLKRIS